MKPLVFFWMQMFIFTVKVLLLLLLFVMKLLV